MIETLRENAKADAIKDIPGIANSLNAAADEIERLVRCLMLASFDLRSGSAVHLERQEIAEKIIRIGLGPYEAGPLSVENFNETRGKIKAR